MPSRRYHELDVVRGLAAFIVLLHHVWMSFPQAFHVPPLTGASGLADYLFFALKYTPARFLVAGPGCVAVFFVLSGFVLSASFENGRGISYGQYVVKRLCRIYLPFAAAVLVAAGFYAATYKGAIPGMSDWLNTTSWSMPLTPDLVLGHLAAYGMEPYHDLNAPMWSLIVELRASLIFPLVFLLVRSRSLWAPLLALGLYMAAAGFMSRDGQTLPMTPLGSLAFLFQWMPLFFLGSALWFQRERLERFFSGLPAVARLGLVAMALLLLGMPAWGPVSTTSMAMKLVWMLGMGFSATVIITAAISTALFHRLAAIRPLRRLGEISYSLYLFHQIVILALAHGLVGIVPPGLAVLLAIPVSLVVAELGYRLVETPSMRLGQRLTRGAPRPAAEARPALEPISVTEELGAVMAAERR
ncbi:O-acetyl transferase [Roseomonas mucosa]|uniref:O-acetyltransferase OatA n=1 Tax=Roseomonas mucosa TaxID=207340 RepID=A0A379MWT0_9PROT|nr:MULTISPECIES: acyltransferase [Roseomonas]MBS5904883.1 acyltransferase [Acetobacteraceae bacterium]MDT8289088.1 acyltransferase [Roseomonas mucosa]MDT8295923.1 acyltransferase [Roseomonas mucosa]MDT8313005.1 acyltransferase [Roseomonas mucosa]MDT8349321.1 acyltransferase [Roseomonas mucosa]